MVKNKIKIAVSSCLLGEAVRYDGTDKHIEYITQQLAKEYTLISLCPEMAIGMGVPRPPIHLVNDGKSIQAIGIDDPSTNVTKPLTEFGMGIVQAHSDICGYILKKNSPSCGINNVKVLDNHGEYKREGQGIYVATIIKGLPLLPVIDENDCLDEIKMSAFLQDVKTYMNSI